jgi:hypothetical protein
MNPYLIEADDDNYVGVMDVPAELFIEGQPTSETWLSAHYSSVNNFKAGIWIGQPGQINVPAYPVDEIFTIIAGRIELVSNDQSHLIVEAGQSCVVPKGWQGVWHTVQKTTKYYVTFDALAQ